MIPPRVTVASRRAKPAAAKGRYLKKVTMTTTMGPGIPVDPNRTRNLLVDEA